MAGLIIGAVAGAVQFIVLMKFTGAVTGGGFSYKGALYGFAQFLIPLAVLLLVALLRMDMLLYTGIGIIAALIAGAGIKYALALRGKKRRGAKDD